MIEGNQGYFGKQQRSSISKDKLNDHPFNCIGMLQTTFKQGQQKRNSVGTGYLISKYFILTVAHNISISSMKLQKVVFKLIGQILQVQEYRLDSRYTDLLRNQHETEFDFALLKLKKPVQRQKYIQLMPNYTQKKQEYANISLAIYGFSIKSQSIQLNIKTIVYYKQPLFSGVLEKDVVKQINNRIIFYDLTTNAGQSGSPIMIEINEEMKAIGIHKGTDKVKQCNQGLLLTFNSNNGVIDKLKQWEKEMTPSSFKLCQGQQHKQQPQHFWDQQNQYIDNFIFRPDNSIIYYPKNRSGYCMITSRRPINNLYHKIYITNVILPFNSSIEIGILPKTVKHKKKCDFADKRVQFRIVDRINESPSLKIQVLQTIKSYNQQSLQFERDDILIIQISGLKKQKKNSKEDNLRKSKSSIHISQQLEVNCVLLYKKKEKSFDKPTLICKIELNSHNFDFTTQNFIFVSMSKQGTMLKIDL